jgi:hypothetical protein
LRCAPSGHFKAENLLDHIAVATLDEADDLHLSAATVALQRVERQTPTD